MRDISKELLILLTNVIIDMGCSWLAIGPL